MRIRLTLEITRSPKPAEPSETFESQGSLVEQIGQPRYSGFTPEIQPNEYTR